jgi:ribosomal protein L7Ae-like RNA K-turn-binding protein
MNARPGQREGYEKDLLQRVKPDSGTISLVGFALRARQVVLGFEAVRRAATHGKLAGVMVSADISSHTLEKVVRAMARLHVPVFQTDPAINWGVRWGIDAHKILGFQKSELGRTIINKFKAGA